jgi:hypothetical protein
MARSCTRSLFAISLVASCLAACARDAPLAAVNAGMHNLKCPRSDIETSLVRQTPKVREYVVACDFMYTRVHCSDHGCQPAPLQPPCTGDLCFEEDPVTLQWKPKTVDRSPL